MAFWLKSPNLIILAMRYLGHYVCSVLLGILIVQMYTHTNTCTHSQASQSFNNQPVNYCCVCDSVRNTELQSVYWRPPKNLQHTILHCYTMNSMWCLYFYRTSGTIFTLHHVIWTSHQMSCDMIGMDNNPLSAPLIVMLPKMQCTMCSRFSAF